MMRRLLGACTLALVLGFTTTGGACGECPAMDGAGEGPCDAFFGYAWTGDECSGVSGCSCIGVDCDATYADREACEQAFSSC